MAVVLDFQSTVLDGTTAGTVPWSSFTWNASAAAYLSPVIQVRARSSQYNIYRPAPNNVYIGSDYIRVSDSSAGVLTATWGADLAINDDLEPGGLLFYIQFKRPAISRPGDGVGDRSQVMPSGRARAVCRWWADGAHKLQND
jgi:hypothetical protein